MKVYILKDEDFDKLFSKLSIDNFKERRSISKNEERIYDEAYRFYNYVLRRWMDEVNK